MSEFGTWGSIKHHRRYHEPVEPRSRRRCSCGCKTRATHRGMVNGVALDMGCEFYMRRWVRDGAGVYRSRPTTTASAFNEGAEG